MEKEILKQIIRDFHKNRLPLSKPRTLKIPLNTRKIVTISGVRRSGKTFVLFETIKKLLSLNVPQERILYVNFEDERLQIKRESLDAVVQAYRELYPDFNLNKCYFFFDEIQNIDGWEKFIRRIYDTVTKNIFVTGSNSKLLSREIATSLRGRTITYEVFPLSFREYLEFNKVDIDLYHTSTIAKIANLFEKFLFEGGFPELTTFKDSTLKNKVLQNYIDVMLYRDIVERFNIKNSSILKYFLKRIFENITSPLSIHKIYNEIKSQGYKIGKNYLYEYLEYLEEAYFFILTRKYTSSILKQELTEKKAYAIDNGFLNAFTFKFSHDWGKLLENMVFLELIKQGKKVFFYKNKHECDFIVMEGNRKKIVQVCLSIQDKDTYQREINGIIEVAELLGMKSACIVTFSEENIVKKKGLTIDIIPAFKFVLT